MRAAENVEGQQAQAKYSALKVRLAELQSVVVGFSGGVDSTLLIRAALDALGPERMLAVTVCSPVMRAAEVEDACRLAAQMGTQHRIVEVNVLELPGFAANPPERCYLCKGSMLRRLWEIARGEGYRAVAEGSNVDDAERNFRPGLRAVDELGVCSPLREVGLSKSEIRALSRRAGLATFDRPSSACLATRFPYGERITEEKLRRVERAEEMLFRMGFTQLRVRDHGGLARIELGSCEDITRLLRREYRRRVVEEFKALSYNYVSVDLEGYRSGSMNEVLAPEQESAGLEEERH